MSKKILYLGLTIIMIITILLVGCTKEHVIKDTETKASNETASQDNDKTEIENNNDTENKNTIEDIQAALEKDESIADITWSKDNSRVAFTKDIGDFQWEMYIWKIGEEKEEQVEGVRGNLHDIFWSPDGKNITIDEGTCEYKETIIVAVEKIEIIDRLENTGGPIWSPDGSKLAFAVLNDKEPSIPIEMDGTYDLMIYDIETKTQEIVLEAESTFFYNPISWDENGLKYEKYYFDKMLNNEKPEVFIYNENSEDNQDGNYEITTETYTEKNEKVEIEIKYPIVKNMADTDIENKINSSIKERVDGYKQLYHAEDEGYKETIYSDYEKMREKEDILSIRFFISLYTEGAAHPNNLMDGVTFDLKTGKELALNDLFKEDIDYAKALNPIFKEKVNELEYELFEEYKGIEEEQGFYLTDNSLVVYYQEYVYTPHAVGPLLLEVSLDEIKDILK